MANSASAKPGRNMYVGIGIQSAKGSSATIYTYYQPTEVGGFMNEYSTITSNRRLNTRFKGADYIGSKQVPFNFSVEVNADDIGRILKLALGAETTSAVATGVTLHKFYPNETLSYATLYCYAAGIADTSGTDKVLKVTDAKINRIRISGGLDDVVIAEIEGIGMAVAALTSPTASFSTVDPLFLNSDISVADLEIGDTVAAAASFAEAREMEFEVNNGINADHRITSSATAEAIREGDSTLSGRLNYVYNENSFAEINEHAANDVRGIDLTIKHITDPIVGSNYHQMQIVVEKARYTGAPPSFDPDLITVDMPFSIELPSSQSFYIQIQNAAATQYTYSV